MSLEEQILNAEDILSYARAAIVVGDKVKELSREKGVNILIPSRGSYPIWDLAKKYLYLQKNPSYFETLRGTDMPIDSLFPHESYERKDGGILIDVTKLNQEIILPVSSFSEDLSSTQKLREFWMNTYNGIQKQDKSDMGIKFYKYILQNVSKFLTDEQKIKEISEMIRGERPKTFNVEQIRKYVPQTFQDRKTILIDTAISGTCITHLLGAIEKMNANFHTILLTDHNGREIKNKNRAYLTKLQTLDKLTEIPVPNIFTEDNGPSLLGVTTIVYPSIIEQFSKSHESKNRGLDFFGAACWMPLPYRTPKTDKVAAQIPRMTCGITKSMLADALAIEMYHDGFKIPNMEYPSLVNSFVQMRTLLVGLLKDQKLLDANNTLAQYKPFLEELADTKDITTTRSHVIKVNYTAEKSARIVSDFYKSLR